MPTLGVENVSERSKMSLTFILQSYCLFLIYASFYTLFNRTRTF